MKGHKKILFISLFYLITLQANAQIVVTNNGTAIKIAATVTVTIENGGFTNKTNGSDLGTIDNAGVITLTKDWENNSANTVFTTTTAGVVQFLGTAAELIKGTNATDFYNLTINNTSVAGITMSQPASVTNTLTLTDGVIYSDVTNFITMNAGSAVSPVGGTSTEFVDGPIAKAGATAFIFPVGNGTKWARVGIGAPTASTTFKAHYVAASPVNTAASFMATSPTPVLTNISIIENWALTRAAGTGDATVTLYWESATFSGINNCLDLRVAHWNGTKWENNNNAVSTSGSCTGVTAGSISTTAVVTSFSPFTFGSLSSVGSVNPLPIELLSFEAHISKNTVNLHWATASEINNDFFTIERTTDGINFEVIGTVKGNGNSTSVIHYASADYIPYGGVSYYRLKQTDFDGKATFSGLKMVSFENDADYLFYIFPNPGDGAVFSFQINLDKNEAMQVVVHDVLGSEVYSEAIISNEDDSNIYTIHSSEKLIKGIYLITVSSPSKIVNNRLIVN